MLTSGVQWLFQNPPLQNARVATGWSVPSLSLNAQSRQTKTMTREAIKVDCQRLLETKCAEIVFFCDVRL